MSVSDGGWRSAWIAFAALISILWVMAQDRSLREDLWAGFLGLFGFVP